MPFVPEMHVIYTVQPGDSLYNIAQRFQSDVALIMNANSVYPPFTESDLIYPGQVLLVPTFRYGKTNVDYMVQPGDTLWNIAATYGTYPELIAGISNVPDPAVIYVNQMVHIPAFVYMIQPGETLLGIANQTGIPLADIIRANQRRPYFNPDVIFSGYRLIIPASTSPNLFVQRPLPGEAFSDGQEIGGFARAFEANVNVQVRDANGVVVSEERATTAENAAPAYAPFHTAVPFDRSPTSSMGELWVYTRSAEDDSIQDLVRVSIRFV